MLLLLDLTLKLHFFILYSAPERKLLIFPISASTQEAERLGLITRICDGPLTEAFKLAKDIANKSPDAIIAGKRLLEEAWHRNSTDGLILEEELQKSLLGSPNQVETIRANNSRNEKRFS